MSRCGRTVKPTASKAAEFIHTRASSILATGTNNQQGSNFMDTSRIVGPGNNTELNNFTNEFVRIYNQEFAEALDKGVPPERARLHATHGAVIKMLFDLTKRIEALKEFGDID